MSPPALTLSVPASLGRGESTTAAARDQPPQAAGPTRGYRAMETRRDVPHKGRNAHAQCGGRAAAPGTPSASWPCVSGAAVPVRARPLRGRAQGTTAGSAPCPGPFPSEGHQKPLLKPDGLAGTGISHRTEPKRALNPCMTLPFHTRGELQAILFYRKKKVLEESKLFLRHSGFSNIDSLFSLMLA